MDCLSSRIKELTCWVCLTDLNWPQPSPILVGYLLMRLVSSWFQRIGPWYLIDIIRFSILLYKSALFHNYNFHHYFRTDIGNISGNRCKFNLYIDGLVQERRNSIAKALELCFSCTNPWIWKEQCYMYANYWPSRHSVLKIMDLYGFWEGLLFWWTFLVILSIYLSGFHI